jgi:hypothetical protein
MRVDEKLHISTRTISDHLAKSLYIDDDEGSDSPQSPRKQRYTDNHDGADEGVVEGTVYLISFLRVTNPFCYTESLFYNKRFKIDFTPLYQCHNVYKALNLESEFQQNYRDNRKVTLLSVNFT